MKLLDRFRKIIMRFIFPGFPARPRSTAAASCEAVAPRRRSCDKVAVEPPKTSCSSSYNYYSSSSHYNEAIADCIEFFNNSSSSSQDGYVRGGQKSDGAITVNLKYV